MNFQIANRFIGKDNTPFIIAEMSGNHNQSLKRALQIVDAAAEAGVHAIKLQTYTADTMTLDINEGEFLINEENNLWKGYSLHDLYKMAYTPWEWHEPIMKHAAKSGIICFSSPFDETSVDFLESLNVPAYKISSFELTDIPLVRKVAVTGKPMIISTGMATVAEIGETVQLIRDLGCEEFVLLKCTSTYPANPADSNILTIPHMRELFDCEVGISDHTMGIGAAIAAVAHGAQVVEKHFTLRRIDGGVDSKFSLEPEEMRLLVLEIDRAWQSIGKITYGPSRAELSSVNDRRSLYITKNLNSGDVLTSEYVRCIRPGRGLAPKYFDLVLGRKVSEDVRKGTPLTWELIE